jgi:hypothetical protein
MCIFPSLCINSLPCVIQRTLPVCKENELHTNDLMRSSQIRPSYVQEEEEEHQQQLVQTVLQTALKFCLLSCNAETGYITLKHSLDKLEGQPQTKFIMHVWGSLFSVQTYSYCYLTFSPHIAHHN